jgi:hypothetical protein
VGKTHLLAAVRKERKRTMDAETDRSDCQINGFVRFCHPDVWGATPVADVAVTWSYAVDWGKKVKDRCTRCPNYRQAEAKADGLKEFWWRT